MISDARRKRRWQPASAVLIAAAVFFAVLWSFERPQQRLRYGLTAVAAHDWERLQYTQMTLPHTAKYTAPNKLFAAAVELDRRDLVAAFRDLRLAADDPALRPTAWLLAGEALYAQHRFREAEMNLKHAVQLDPELVEAHRWLAIAYYDIGLMNEAMLHLQRVTELDTRDGRPHRVMALIHLDLGSYAIAIEDFQESLRRQPNPPDREDMLVELAACQLAVKRYDDAQRTLASCRETGEVLAMRADAHYALGEREEAKRLAEQALETEPELRLALSVLGKLALDDRRFNDAIDFLTRGTQAAPSDYGLQYGLVTALRAAGKKEAAEKQLAAAEAIREMRENYDALVERATAEPYDADIRYQLGLLAAEVGLSDLATAWMKAAVILEPNHRLALAELKKRNSSSPGAAQMLRGS